MRDSPGWWIRPFVGSILALVGVALIVGILIVGFFGPAFRGVFALGGATADAVGSAFDEDLFGFFLPIPSARIADLDIAPGAPGYQPTLAGGHQLHFRDDAKNRTRIAVDASFGDVMGGRYVVAEYDGPPSVDVPSDHVRDIQPLFAMVTIHVVGGGDVWCMFGDRRVGPFPPDAGELNLLVVGKVTLWTGDGPHEELDVADHETVWCTLGPSGLTIDRRR